jgi:hypothetical protein
VTELTADLLVSLDGFAGGDIGRRLSAVLRASPEVDAERLSQPRRPPPQAAVAAAA